MTGTWADEREFAVRIAREAGRVALDLFDRVAVESKADGSEVTDADRRAEELLRDRFASHCSSDAVLGEEFGGSMEPVQGRQWVVDPIDGTASFVLGLPLFGTLVSLVVDGEPVVGVVHLPGTDETLHAASGEGVLFESPRGTAPVRCSGTATLAEAFASTGGTHASDVDPREGGERYRLSSLVHGARRFRPVLDCVQHAMVARGRLDLAIDPIMAPWDAAAPIACVREAGGAVCAIDGGTDTVAFGGSLVSAASAELLSDAMAAIRT